jgi:hypothetical protein
MVNIINIIVLLRGFRSDTNYALSEIQWRFGTSIVVS